MFLLPESPKRTRMLRMAITFSICASCSLLGWSFMDIASANIAALPRPTLDQPLRALTRAILPGILCAYLWTVAFAFLLLTLIKIDIRNKEAHLNKFIVVMNLGRGSLWLTAPIAALWVLANLYVGFP
jgi:hypothetical protein